MSARQLSRNESKKKECEFWIFVRATLRNMDSLFCTTMTNLSAAACRHAAAVICWCLLWNNLEVRVSKKIAGKTAAAEIVVRPYRTPICICVLVSLLCAFPSAHGQLLFSARVAGPVANLYSIDAAGELHKITDNIRWRDMDADISPDGRIVFSSNREPNPKIDLERRAEHFHVYLTDSDGGIVPLTSGDGDERTPRFAPDGETIAFVRRVGGSQQLVLVGPDSDGRIIFSGEEILDFSWAPGGKRLCLAVRSGGEPALWLVNTDGGDGVAVPMRGNDWIAAARWSPNGGHIALVRHPQQSGDRRLTLLELESGRERQLSPAGAQVQGTPEWSRDGGRLLYAALLDYEFSYDETAHKKVYKGAMHIFESDLDGGTRQLTRGDGLHRAPVYSPDGKAIAYLYAGRLDARRLALRVADRNGGEAREVYTAVARLSGLRWF